VSPRIVSPVLPSVIINAAVTHRDDRVDGETGCQKIRLKVELSNEMSRLWNIT
jgi:hypothetical protein